MLSSSKYKFGLLWSIGFVVFALVPVLMTSRYQMNLASHILIWGLFAVSFNMLWGVTGMLSFGQALYFGIGAYSIGLFVTHAGKGWYLAAIPIGLVVATGLSFLIGLLVIRVSGVYFTMLTLAFAQLAWQITFKWYNFTGGDDGIQGIIAPGILANKMVYYYVILVVVFLSVWFLKRLAYSPFGLILRCIQQNPNRVRFIGRSVKMNQLRIYVISSFFAALAGTLMAGVDNSIHTDMLYWTTSGEVILMSVLGGINQFFGPFIGAVILILLEDIIGAKTEYWPIFLGTIIMVFVIALPRGVVGELRHIKHRLKGTEEPGGRHETHAAA
jgi:branched-chain amino acid transport system permease protein